MAPPAGTGCQLPSSEPRHKRNSSCNLNVAISLLIVKKQGVTLANDL